MAAHSQRAIGGSIYTEDPLLDSDMVEVDGNAESGTNTCSLLGLLRSALCENSFHESFLPVVLLLRPVVIWCEERRRAKR